MSPAFKDFIQSEQFTFYVGQAGKPIVVHSAAIAATSQHLDALINGGMGEAATRCAQIKDVEVDDFIRFCEYAYRGDYSTPPWEDDLQEPIPNGDADYWDDNWAPPTTSKKKKKSQKSRVETVPDVYEAVPAPEDPPIDEYPAEPVACEEAVPADMSPPDFSYHAAHVSRISLRNGLKNRTYLDNDNPKAQILQHFEPKPNTAVTQNFTTVLLAHARLYCFAHLRLIEPLKALTLDKLHKTLMSFELYTQRVGDIIELARFAYSNAELPDRDDGTIDDLRKLVVEYIVCEIDTIGKCDEFVKYIEDGGEFVGDFWRLARDYVV